MPQETPCISNLLSKLINGHLRRDVNPDVEVKEEEARKLLLTIDPLASLAEQQEQIRARLLTITPAVNPDLQLAWQTMADALLETPHDMPPRGPQSIEEQYLILLTCRDEKEQIELLFRRSS